MVVSCVLLAAFSSISSFARFAAAEPSAAEFDGVGVRKPPIPVSFLAHNAGWIELLYPPSARDRVGAFLAHAEEARTELAELLGQPPVQSLEVRIARNPEELMTLSPLESPPPGGSTGVAYPSIRLLLVSLAQADGSGDLDLGAVFRRELARFAMQEATGPKRSPEWFQNGFADRFAGRSAWWREGALLWAAARHRLVPLLTDERRVFSAEGARAAEESRSRNELLSAESADFVDFLLAAPRHTRFPTCVNALQRGETLSAAIREAYGSDAFVLESAWRRQVALRATLVLSALATGIPVMGVAIFIGVRYLRNRKNRRPGAASPGREHRHAKAAGERRRVHIVLGRRGEAPDMANFGKGDIPKIEHEGEWHTLH